MREGRWRRAAIRVIVFALLACLLSPLALAEDQMIDPAYPVPGRAGISGGQPRLYQVWRVVGRSVC